MAEKNKKDKPTYVDDGRPLADMSGIDAGLGRFFRSEGPSTGSFRDRWDTYWSAFRMMLLCRINTIVSQTKKAPTKLVGAFFLVILRFFPPQRGRAPLPRRPRGPYGRWWRRGPTSV